MNYDMGKSTRAEIQEDTRQNLGATGLEQIQERDAGRRQSPDFRFYGCKQIPCPEKRETLHTLHEVNN